VEGGGEGGSKKGRDEGVIGRGKDWGGTSIWWKF